MSRMSDAILMAYADGELGVRERAAIEAEIAVDPDLARRADRHRRLRLIVAGAYEDERGAVAALRDDAAPLVLPIVTGRRQRPWWLSFWPWGR